MAWRYPAFEVELAEQAAELYPRSARIVMEKGLHPLLLPSAMVEFGFDHHAGRSERRETDRWLAQRLRRINA